MTTSFDVKTINSLPQFDEMGRATVVYPLNDKQTLKVKYDRFYNQELWVTIGVNTEDLHVELHFRPGDGRDIFAEIQEWAARKIEKALPYEIAMERERLIAECIEHERAVRSNGLFWGD